MYSRSQAITDLPSSHFQPCYPRAMLTSPRFTRHALDIQVLLNRCIGCDGGMYCKCPRIPLCATGLTIFCLLSIGLRPERRQLSSIRPCQACTTLLPIEDGLSPCAAGVMPTVRGLHLGSLSSPFSIASGRTRSSHTCLPSLPSFLLLPPA